MEPVRKNAGNTRGKPFAPGNSGKPKGARHKVTLAIEALLDGEASALTRKAIDLAKAGDMQALKLCMDRLAPPRKDRSIAFELPPIETVDDLPRATRAIMDAVSVGDITPSEAAELGKLVDAHVRAIEVSDISKRLEALEKRDFMTASSASLVRRLQALEAERLRRHPDRLVVLLGSSEADLAEQFDKAVEEGRAGRAEPFMSILMVPGLFKAEASYA